MGTPAPQLLRYLVEWYRPEVSEESLDDTVATLHKGVASMTADGSQVQLLIGLAAPTDEVLFGVFAASSEQVVIDACERAGLPAQRLTAAVDARITSPIVRETPDSSPTGTPLRQPKPIERTLPMSIQTRTRKAVARTAVVAAADGFTAVPFAAPASAEVINQNIGVAQCDPPPDQLCTPTPSVTVTYGGGDASVVFTASENHCSNITAHVRVDGMEWVNERLAPGQESGRTANLAAGTHTVSVQAEGVQGGCNGGHLDSWAGRLYVETTP
jgi:hypothetical protein